MRRSFFFFQAGSELRVLGNLPPPKDIYKYIQTHETGNLNSACYLLSFPNSEFRILKLQTKSFFFLFFIKVYLINREKKKKQKTKNKNKHFLRSKLTMTLLQGYSLVFLSLTSLI